jgi:hypothetical protein
MAKLDNDTVRILSSIRAEADRLSAVASKAWVLATYAPEKRDLLNQFLAEARDALEALNDAPILTGHDRRFNAEPPNIIPVPLHAEDEILTALRTSVAIAQARLRFAVIQGGAPRFSGSDGNHRDGAAERGGGGVMCDSVHRRRRDAAC